MWTTRFDTTGQAIPDRSKARADILLCEDVYGRLRRLVGRLERCAEVIETTPEARIVGAIHCSIDEGDYNGGGVEVEVIMAVVGGMRAGARARDIDGSTAAAVVRIEDE